MKTTRDSLPWTMRNAETFVPEDSLVRFVALFHDLGKGICKDGGKFLKHENVGGFLLFWLACEIGDKELIVAAELCFMHMLAHKGFSWKAVKRNNWSEGLLRVALRFAEIDDMSRVVIKKGGKEIGKEENAKRVRRSDYP